MLYCEKCRRLYEDGEYCPECRKSRLRAPEENDAVLLATVDHLRAEMLDALLTDENVPHDRSGGVAGAFGMGVAMRLDPVRFFVSFRDYERAHDIGLSVFGDKGEIIEDAPEE